MTSKDDPDPAAVLAAFGLPGPAEELVPVAGAWSNRVYRLTAGGQRYAVKQLRNPWGDPRWREWLAAAFEFELRALAAGVAMPEPVPNPADGGCLASVAARDGDRPVPVRVHRWVAGRNPDRDAVDPTLAGWAGEVLAILHRLGVRPADRSLFPVTRTDTADRWPELAEAAHRAGSRWAGRVAEVAPAVRTIAELARSAGHHPEVEVMTHGDVDPKNIVVAADGPRLCDWDVAAPLEPRRELADVAMSMAGWERFGLANEVVRAYRAAGGEAFRLGPTDLGQSMMIGLDWVAFNLERAIGARPASPAEAALGDRLAPGLLAELPAHVDVALRIDQVLDS
jgi:Ser/Thr protein kinase RdoA (MazF antagonist)